MPQHLSLRQKTRFLNGIFRDCKVWFSKIQQHLKYLRSTAVYCKDMELENQNLWLSQFLWLSIASWNITTLIQLMTHYTNILTKSIIKSLITPTLLGYLKTRIQAGRALSGCSFKDKCDKLYIFGKLLNTLQTKKRY